MIWGLLKMFRPDASASPFIRILLCLLAFVVLGCHAATTLKQPTLTPGTHATTGDIELACAPHTDDSGAGEPCNNDGCKFQWLLDGTEVSGAGDTAKYIPKKNGAYTCKTTKAAYTTSPPSADETVNTLPTQPALSFTEVECGKETELTCVAAASGKPPATDTLHLAIKSKSGDTYTLVHEGDAAGDASITTNVAKSKNGLIYVCIAKTTTDVDASTKGLRSYSDEQTLTCTATVAPTQASTGANSGSTGGGSGSNTGSSGGSGGGGNSGSTGSGGSGTTSGASDLGRPASVLTIVCSLLALTLALRG